MNKEPFSQRGRIERWFGPQNKAAATSFYDRPLSIIPRDEDLSTQIGQMQLVCPDDGTMRVLEGILWVSFLFPTNDKSQPEGTLEEAWHHYGSAFDARRNLAENVAGSYIGSGEQRQNRFKAIRQANKILNRLQSGPLSDDEMAGLHNETAVVMNDAKYMASVIPQRMRTGEQLLLATQRDSRGRPNQPAGRMRIDSRRPHMITDLQVNDHIALKNLHRASELDTEFDFEETVLKRFERNAWELYYAKTGTGAFERDLPGFLAEAHNLLSPKTTILLQPYSLHGARLRYLLFATDFASDVITLAKYMELKEAIEFTDKYPTFNTLTLKEKRDRIQEIFLMTRKSINQLTEDRYEGPKLKVSKQRSINTNEEKGNFPMEKDGKDEVTKSVGDAETPEERRRRLRLEREWKWIDRHTEPKT